MAENVPALDSDLLPVWNAFVELSGRRQSGFSPCPLSLLEIATWMDLNGIRGFERRGRWARLIIALDNHWMKVTGEKNERNRKTGSRN